MGFLYSCVLFAVFAAAIYGIYVLDTELRGLHIMKQANSQSALKITLQEALMQVDNIFVFVPLAAVLVLIMIWCCYLRIHMATQHGSKIMWVEVQDNL